LPISLLITKDVDDSLRDIYVTDNVLLIKVQLRMSIVMYF